MKKSKLLIVLGSIVLAAVFAVGAVGCGKTGKYYLQTGDGLSEKTHFSVVGKSATFVAENGEKTKYELSETANDNVFDLCSEGEKVGELSINTKNKTLTTVGIHTGVYKKK